MSLQSTNGNQNIEMIPPNDEKNEGTPTSSSTLKSNSINSSLLHGTQKMLMEQGHAVECGVETNSLTDDNNLMTVQSSENDIAVSSNRKIDDRSLSIPKVRVKVSSKRNWRNVHARMLLNQHKYKNGYKRACQKIVRMQHKRLGAKIMNKSKIPLEMVEVDQKSEHESPQSCITRTDFTSRKETFLDKLELHKHTTIAHPDVSMKFCHLCNETFLDVELQGHTLAIHGQASEVVEQQDVEQSNILNEFERIEECSDENIPESIQTLDQLMNDSEDERKIDVNVKKSSIKSMKFIEKAINEPMKNFPDAVKVEIADGESDIYSYTALEEKKEYCSKDYENCQGVNERTILECEWSSPKENNYNENTQDSISTNNEAHLENCLVSSMEEFQDIEELETSCEVEYLEKVQHIEQILENGNDTCTVEETRIISDASSQSINMANEFIEDEMNDEPSNQELIRILSDDLGTISSSTVPSSSTCRTYLSKMNSHSSRKPPIKINNINVDEEINFCIMCREIFSLIEQKSIKPNSDPESFFKCPLCSRQFELRSSLEKHVAYHHLNCECTKVTVSPSTLEALETSVALESYECVLCPAVFNNYGRLNDHILTLHEPTPPFKDRLTIGKPEYIRTVRCSFMESKTSPMKNRNNSIPIIKIKCPNCESTFLTCDDYLLHMREFHSDTAIIDNNSCPSMETSQNFGMSTAEGLNICTANKIEINGPEDRTSVTEICDLDVEKNFEELQNICKRCDKEFKTIRELSEHLYFSHDDSLESQAIMAAASSIDRDNHDWCCVHCSQRFKLLKSYIRHRYFVHNDESMVHVCDNCSKILTSITMVNVHVCLNVSSWECKPCHLSFANGVELRVHNTAEHTEIPGPYICLMCQKRFLTMSMLRRHQQSKKCYPHVRPPELSNIMRNPLKQHSTIKRSRATGKKMKVPSERKVKKEYSHLHDLSHMRVIQEDVFIRDAKVKENFQKNKNKNNHLSPVLLKSEPSDEIYQCSMCKLYFLSKAGLKVHLSRAHTSAVEICQLCYKMFVTGNLVRHITDNHLKHDNNNQSYYKAMRVKLHNTFDIDEHDIERDTEELIATIGTNQLLGLCEYQRFTEQSDDNDRFCPDCPLTFDNSEKYRRHYVQTHDKLCALCNMEFETGQEAARHKTRIHGSMACYVWFAHKLIAAISDTKTFSEIAEKIITDTIPLERHDDCRMEIEENIINSDLAIDVVMEATEDAEMIVGTNEKTEEWLNNGWAPDNLLSKDSLNEESNALIDASHLEEQVEVAENNHLHDGDDNNDSEDHKLFILVTEDDLKKFKNNVAELAQQIYATCNLFSIDQIERMLEPYAKT